MSYIWKIVIMSVCAYFLGNITFARIIAKRKGDDITSHGSGNPGTSNMLRTHGAKRGFLTLLLDLLKGAVSALVAFFVCGGFKGGWQANLAVYIVGLFAVIGHIYPVIYKFKGGKGVATAAGVVAVANPIALFSLFILHWGILYFVKVASSVMSLSAVFIFIIVETIMLCVKGYFYSLIPLYIMLIIILWAFRGNIKRIFEKKEGKMDLKAAFEKDREESNKKKTPKSEQNDIKQ